MKLDNKTLQILKNFSLINSSMRFKEGNTLTVVSSNKNILARANIAEGFPRQFAISDLPRLLGVLSLFDTPEIEFTDTHLIISANNQKVNFTFADPRMIVTTDANGINMPDAEVEFTLTPEDFSRIMKAHGIMGLPDVAVTGEDGEMYIEATNVRSPTTDNYRIHLGAMPDPSREFKMVFRPEYLKLMNATYNVRISSRGIAEFKSDDITYWITTETTSTFN
jgi:hypothetical protein